MNDINNFTVLILPGRDGSGSDHWQTLWEREFPEFVRVEQINWVWPVYAEWAINLTSAVTQSQRPVLLIAHSAGTSLTMRWAHDQPGLAKKVAGALLVAPSDRDVMEGKLDNPIQGFGKMILSKIPFSTTVVASRNDPLVSFERATAFATAWGSKFVDAGNSGHLGTAANLGLWPLGLVALGQLVERVSTHRGS